MSLIREGRRLLCNIYQLVHFSLAVSGTLGAVVVLATVAPVSSPPSISSGNILFIELALTCFVGFPMLASAITPSQLKQPQAKNEISLKWKEEVGRFLSYFAMRTLPTAIVCVFIYIWAFGEFLAKYDSSDVASCHTSQDQMEWYHITWCAGVESGRNLSHVKIAHQKAEALMVFSLVLALGVQSAGFLQRTASLVAFTPLSNQLWFAGMLFTVVLQLLFSLAQAGVISSTGPSKWTPWQLWLVVVTWPFISLGIGERVKAWDAAHHKLDLKYLELEFNTKLGQFSPR
jgi:magnesium-transporting ATPase (P-type)